MKNKTAEEVYVEMLKPAESVTLKVQYRPDDFSVVKDVPGDGFYIRYVCLMFELYVKQLTLIFPNSLMSLHPAIYRSISGATWMS